MLDGFTILKKCSDGGIAWRETIKNLDAARERIKFLATNAPGEYVVFWQATQRASPENSVGVNLTGRTKSAFCLLLKVAGSVECA
jgi:hypothetical protein